MPSVKMQNKYADKLAEIAAGTKVVRTERGWSGHFVSSHRCLFRRNTLLERGDVRVVVSTVGALRRDAGQLEPVASGGVYYETMVFHAYRESDRYWDADVHRQVRFDSPWKVVDPERDDLANDVHEVVVDEITRRLEQGEQL